MIKIIGRVSLLILLLSCGIPSFEYINEPTINSALDSSFSFTISLGDNSYINGFKIYARYFIDQSDNSSFDEIDISDTSDETEDYLEKLGYSVVSIIDISKLTNEIIDYKDPDELFVEEFLISSSVKYNVKYNNDSALPITMSLEDNSESFTFISNYDDLIHTIGNYSDDNGKKFLEELEQNENKEIVESIWVEFAIFNLGISSDLEQLESLPVYCTAIKLQS